MVGYSTYTSHRDVADRLTSTLANDGRFYDDNQGEAASKRDSESVKQFRFNNNNKNNNNHAFHSLM
jgi:hypothetical protein